MPTTSKGYRYPAPTAAPNVPQDIQNLASDVDALTFTNVGTSGVMAGSAPPAGTAIKLKSWYGSLNTNSNGDTALTFPGGAFPNGVLGVHAMVALAGPALSPVFWIGVGCTLSVVSLRAYDASSVAAASLAIPSTVIAIGW